MCGITGLLNSDREPIDSVILDMFTDALAHRGPDGRGIHIDQNAGIGLGHRRLAILDLSPSGLQPMSYANGRYWITYNGEIYNFLELRENLKGMGYLFRTESDTEVVLAAYAQWGEECLFHLNGMWAFAIWDALDRKLFLSRDRFGIKPLHYIVTSNHFAFSSEMKAFLALPWFSPEIDLPILNRALSSPLSMERTTECWLSGVRRLPAGHSLSLYPGKPLRIRRWWNTLDHLENSPRSFKACTKRFYELFYDACRIRMRSDRPIGTALSGGLDSGSVLCMMSQVCSRENNGIRRNKDWQRGFVAVYKDTTYDETQYAKKVIEYISGNGIYQDVVADQFIDQMDSIIFQLEDVYFEIPVGPWLIYKTMRENGVFVSMDGHGGDEILGGYHHHIPMAMADSLRPFPNPIRYRNLRSSLNETMPAGFQFCLPPLVQVLRKKIFPCDTTPFQDFNEDKVRIRFMDCLTQGLYVDTHYTTLPAILRNFDRCSMAHGVEIRTPLLDWRLVCFCFSVSGTKKIGRGYNKRLLRAAMKGRMPESIRNRKNKLGFGHPHLDWIKTPLKPFIIDVVNSRSFKESPIFNGMKLRKQVLQNYTECNWQRIDGIEKYILAVRLPLLFSHQKKHWNSVRKKKRMAHEYN